MNRINTILNSRIGRDLSNPFRVNICSKFTIWLLIYSFFGFGPHTFPVICIEEDGSVELEILCKCHPQSNKIHDSVENNPNINSQLISEPEDNCGSCVCIPINLNSDSPILLSAQNGKRVSPVVHQCEVISFHQKNISVNSNGAYLRQQAQYQFNKLPLSVVLLI
jgi:hypothetical protein